MERISESLNHFFQLASDMIYPENMYCVCCGDLLPKVNETCFCSSCLSKISWAAEDFDSRGFSFNSAFSLMEYDYFAQKIVHNLKFHGQAYLAKPLGNLLGELYLARRGDNCDLSNAIFVPVPMHPDKIRQRGYNQALLLAKYAAETAGASFAPDMLVKTENTASMRTARADGRREGIGNSITLNPAYADSLKDKTIVIVDDVLTTGATAESCAACIKDGDAAEINILTLAYVNYKGND